MHRRRSAASAGEYGTVTTRSRGDHGARARAVSRRRELAGARVSAAWAASRSSCERGEGARIWDVDGNEYIDYVLSWGPLVLGHAPPAVLDALRGDDAARHELRHSDGARGRARRVIVAADAARRDAALRLERHRGDDERDARSRARPPAATRSSSSTAAITATPTRFSCAPDRASRRLGLPNSPGVPRRARGAHARRAVQRSRSAVESVAARRTAVSRRSSSSRSSATPDSSRPIRRFSRAARARREHGALLIFDEVMTGFRIASGGARERFGVTPDLTTLGKVIGGGLPVAAYGGRRDLMEHDRARRAGVSGGHAVGQSARDGGGLATLDALTPELHDAHRRAHARGWCRACARSRRGTACRSPPTARARCGDSSFAREPVRIFADAKESDVELFRRFFHAALERGVYLAPSAFEAAFMSAAHGTREIAETLERFDDACARPLPPERRGRASGAARGCPRVEVRTGMPECCGPSVNASWPR